MRLPHRGTGRARRIPLLALALAVAAVVGVTAVALGSPAPSQPTPPEAGAAQLAVFSQAATPADALPSLFANQLQAWDGWASPELASARMVSASDGQSAYVVPTATGGICVINTNEAFCNPADHSAGASAVDLCSPTLPLGQMEVEWLLPDNSTNVHLAMSDGTEVQFPSGDNVYVTRLPLSATSPVPSSVDWTSGGQASQVSLPIPADAQTAQCEHVAPATAASAQEHRRSLPKPELAIDHHSLRMSGRHSQSSTLTPNAPSLLNTR
jgi:hypothetical protein